ncbi:LexA family protein [Variovorax boronicumulans]|uniref:LexA family protein n=1 Tax=Variovorax boronicumulans TaxID=436515 RepID=UPI0036F1E69C
MKKIAEVTGYPMPDEAPHAGGYTPNIEDADTYGSPKGVPLISWVQAGQWSQIVDNFQPGDAEEWLPCPMRHGPRTYVLTVRGSSMHNPGSDLSFKDGDRIFVDPDREAQHRSLVIVRLDDMQEATFKQLLVEGQERMLLALNPSWPDRIIRINGRASLCGVVIGRVETFI